MKKLVGIKKVIEHVGLGRTQIYEMIREGRFPAGIKIGGARRWDEDQVAAWIEAQIAGGEAA